MALVLKDRVKETSVSTGTGAITLDGATGAYQAFSTIGNGNTTYYCIAGQTTNEWEVGIGTYTTSTDTLSRDTILASSNSGSIVTFSAGTKDVFITYPSEKGVWTDASGSSNYAATVGTTPVRLGATTLTLAGLDSVTLTQDPSTALQAATKQYVDTLVSSGITYHAPVKYEVPNSTGNLNATYNNGTAGVGATLTNAGTQVAFTPDGVVASVNDRILVYNQTNAAQNGVYTVTTVGSGSTNWVLTRATDANSYGLKSPTALGEGDAFFITSGNTGAGETYVCNTVGVITFGTTNITFTQISATQIYSAGTGLTLSGTQFSITNTAVTAASYGAANKTLTATVNAQGQLTALADTNIAIPMSQVTSGVLGATQGGTGQSSYSIGDILYADTTTSLARLADVAVGNALISGGLSAAPAWGKIALASAVSGTLPVANGGTGVTTSTGSGNVVLSTSPTLVTPILGTPQSGDFSTGTFTWPTFNQNTTGTAGNVSGVVAIANGGTGATTRQDAMDVLAGATTAGQYLRGNGTDVVMANIVAGDVPTLNQNTTGTAGGLSGSPSISVGTVTTTAGSAAIPAITTTGDTNTGIFFPAADTIAFTEGGVEGMRINSSGNVGIGTTTPVNATGYTILTLNNATNGGNIQFQNNGTQKGTIYNTSSGLFIFTASATPLVFQTGGGETMRLDASGNLALGVATAAAKFDVAFSDNSRFLLGFGANLDNYYTSGTSGAQIFRTGTTERMRLDSSGRLGLGTSSPRQTLSIGSTLDIYSGGNNSPTVASIRATNNLVLNGVSTGAVFLNFDTGTGGVNFCNGGGTVTASMSSAGGLSATTGSFSTNLLVGSGTALAPGSVSGFGAGVITEPATGYSAAGMVIGNTAGQHGSIVYGSNTMYFGTENGSASTMGVKATLTSAGNFNATGTISGTNITSGGNVTGSSTSCSGNAATATTATTATYWGNTGFPTGNGQDFNSVTLGGIYNIVWGNYSGTLNTPPAANSYGTLEVQAGLNFITQIFYPHSTNTSPCIRIYYNGSWLPWIVSLTSANYTAYAPSLTGSGASGTWGISVTGNSATTTRLAGDIYISPSNTNTLNGAFGIASDVGDMWINYRGYNDGFSYFRTFRVGNGKGGQIATFTGSTGALDVTGNITVGSVSSTGSNNVSALNSSGQAYFGVQEINAYGAIAPGDAFVYTTKHVVLVSDSGSGAIKFATGSATERMRLDNSGNFFIGKTVVNYRTPGLQTENNGRSLGLCSNINAVMFFCDRENVYGDFHTFYYNGNYVGNIATSNGVTTGYLSASDYRLKENIVPMTGALAKVALLKPVTYTWKADGSDGQGFIAHELAEVVPDCVIGEKDGTREEDYEVTPAIPAVLDEEGNEVTPAVEAVMGTRTVPVYQGMDTSFLVATLTAAIQEQQAMINELKAKVAALEAA